MMVTRRAAWTSAAASMAVFMATGSVHAAPAAQVAAPVIEVPPWAVAFGGFGLVAFVLITFLNRVPRSKNDVDVLHAKNQADIIALNKQMFDYQRQRDEEMDKRADEESSRIQALKESQDKTYKVLFEFNAEAVRIMSDGSTTQRENIEIQKALLEKATAAENAATLREQGILERHRATNDNIDATRLSLSMKMNEMAAQLNTIQRVVETLERTVGTDIQGEIATIRTIVTTLQTEMKTLHIEIKEVTKHETPSDNPTPAVPDGAPVTGADPAPAADAAADAGDNPQ